MLKAEQEKNAAELVEVRKQSEEIKIEKDELQKSGKESTKQVFESYKIIQAQYAQSEENLAKVRQQNK